MKWINRKDKLPELAITVLVYCSELSDIHTSYFDIKGVFIHGEYDCDKHVTHWMPLPKSPLTNRSRRPAKACA